MSFELSTINILNIFLFVGIIHGIILSGFLFTKKPILKTNVILGFWILLFAMANLQIVINSSQLYKVFGQSFTLFLPLTFNLFYGPLIWIYIKKNTTQL
ncbi:hypothetical protein [Winogradskyella sp. 3972H.M.0a.05]|uniref:hypothetical protein n=1 Tax=Winogradskyella sp. 3972H.M.0a.05 TaxID=2950277 RepID=UPI003391CE76